MMKRLKWISGVTREDNIKNKYIRDSVGFNSRQYERE